MKNTGVISSGKLPVICSLEGYAPVGDVLVIGCGGTGAYVTAHLSRLISVVGKVNKELKLYLADGDIVEDKNLTRQHFIHNDINRNKAEVLGERYSAAFGIQIGVIPKDIENLSELYFLRSNGNLSTVIVGCVDNNASRKVIREWFTVGPSAQYGNQNWCSKFWIDSGNEERNGQVVCGYIPSSSGYYNSRKAAPSRIAKSISAEFSLPCVTEIYPDILESNDLLNSQISCAERAVSAPQNMQTNVTAATLTMNYLNTIINRDPLKSHCIEFGINNSFTTKLNTPENLSVVDYNRKRHWER